MVADFDLFLCFSHVSGKGILEEIKRFFQIDHSSIFELRKFEINFSREC